MLKKINIILIVFIIALTIISPVYATSEIISGAEDFLSTGKSQSSQFAPDETKFKEAIDTLYGILLGIATVVAVTVGSVIGIKMMTESTEGKAKVKEALVPFVIGCIVVFGAFTIWKIVIEIGYSLEDVGQTAKMLFITRA